MGICVSHSMTKVTLHDHVMVNKPAPHYFIVHHMKSSWDSLVNIIFHPILRVLSAVRYTFSITISLAKGEYWENVTSHNNIWQIDKLKAPFRVMGGTHSWSSLLCAHPVVLAPITLYHCTHKNSIHWDWSQISVTFTGDWPLSGHDIIGISNGSADMADHTTIVLVMGQLTLGLVS